MHIEWPDKDTFSLPYLKDASEYFQGTILVNEEMQVALIVCFDPVNKKNFFVNLRTFEVLYIENWSKYSESKKGWVEANADLCLKTLASVRHAL